MTEINSREIYVYFGADDRFFVTSGISTGEFLLKMIEKSPKMEYYAQKELAEKIKQRGTE